MGATFYHPTMKDLDWDALTERYHDLARRTRTADEFNGVGNRLLGELSASHMGIRASSEPMDNRESVGRLGVRVEPATDAWRITAITPDGPAEDSDTPAMVGDEIVQGVALAVVSSPEHIRDPWCFRELRRPGGGEVGLDDDATVEQRDAGTVGEGGSDCGDGGEFVADCVVDVGAREEPACQSAEEAARAPCDEGEPWRRDEVDAGAVGPHEVVAIEHHVVMVDVGFECDGDGEVDTAVGEPFIEGGGLFEADLEFDVGGVAPEPGGDGVEEGGGAGSFGGADADRAAGVDGGETANGGVVGVDDLAAVGEEFVAVISEAQASAFPAHERAAGAFLEPFEFPTHR